MKEQNNKKENTTFAYIRIMDQIISDINNHVYEVGDMLPTQEEISKRYGVSRMTVREAIKELSRRGVLLGVRGKGTIVQNNPTSAEISTAGVATAKRFSLVEKGEIKAITSKLLSLDKVLPSRLVASRLNLSSNESVVRIKRLRYSSQIPLMVSISYIPHRYVSDVDFINADLEHSSLYGLLHKEAGITFTRADEHLRAIICPNDISSYLGLLPGEPIIHIARSAMTKDDDGKEIVGEYSEHYVRTDIAHIIFHLTSA